jgi:hypothetical protein
MTTRFENDAVQHKKYNIKKYCHNLAGVAANNIVLDRHTKDARRESAIQRSNVAMRFNFA